MEVSSFHQYFYDHRLEQSSNGQSLHAWFSHDMICNHTCAFLRRPPVLPPKIGDGVLGSRVGGFQGAFSFFSSATALLRERALRGTGALLRSAVPLNTLWREGSTHEDAADIIVEAIAAVSADLGVSNSSLQCATGIAERVSLPDKRKPILARLQSAWVPPVWRRGSFRA